MLEFLYQKGYSVDNYHDPCLHPSFECTGLLNRQIKPAGSGRWNKVSAWISNFIKGKKRHVDIKRRGWIFMLTPLPWVNLQGDQLRASPSLAARPFTCNAVLGSCSWLLEANPSSPSLLHKALLHLRRASPSACCWCPHSFPSTVLFDFWWLFRKLLGCLREYLYPWEAVLLAGRFPSLILSGEFAVLQGIRTFGRVSLALNSHEFHRRLRILL